jgi:hypothetical protein
MKVGMDEVSNVATKSQARVDTLESELEVAHAQIAVFKISLDKTEEEVRANVALLQQASVREENLKAQMDADKQQHSRNHEELNNRLGIESKERLQKEVF